MSALNLRKGQLVACPYCNMTITAGHEGYTNRKWERAKKNTGFAGGDARAFPVVVISGFAILIVGVVIVVLLTRPDKSKLTSELENMKSSHKQEEQTRKYDPFFPKRPSGPIPDDPFEDPEFINNFVNSSVELTEANDHRDGGSDWDDSNSENQNQINNERATENKKRSTRDGMVHFSDQYQYQYDYVFKVISTGINVTITGENVLQVDRGINSLPNQQDLLFDCTKVLTIEKIDSSGQPTSSQKEFSDKGTIKIDKEGFLVEPQFEQKIPYVVYSIGSIGIERFRLDGSEAFSNHSTLRIRLRSGGYDAVNSLRILGNEDDAKNWNWHEFDRLISYKVKRSTDKIIEYETTLNVAPKNGEFVNNQYKMFGQGRVVYDRESQVVSLIQMKGSMDIKLNDEIITDEFSYHVDLSVSQID